MNRDAYIQERLDPQIQYYETKSSWNQTWYKRLRLAEIVIACSVSFLVSYADSLIGIKVLAGLLGVAVAVIAGVLSLFRFQELWIDYRSTCESLKQERYLFLTGSGPYAGENAGSEFVTRVEAMLGKEHASWTDRMAPRSDAGTSGGPKE